MWALLTDPELVARCGRELSAQDVSWAVRLVNGLRMLQLSAPVYVVVSMGKLMLTAVPPEGGIDSGDSVGVGRAGGLYAVSYYEAGGRYAVAGRLCEGGELVDLVEVSLLRLLLGPRSA